MISHLLADQNLPFTLALAVMLGLALLEGVGMMMGLLVSSLLDSLLPDLDLDADADLDASAATPGLVLQFLGWLCIGQVPALVILVLFLTFFGVVGLVVQGGINGLVGLYLPALVAAPVAFLVALPLTRAGGKLVAKAMPKEESEAVSRDHFVGQVAVIIRGAARQDSPAEAKLTDRHGYQHYVLVEPDGPEDTFPTGTSVILTERLGARFRAIRNTNPHLMD